MIIDHYCKKHDCTTRNNVNYGDELVCARCKLEREKAFLINKINLQNSMMLHLKQQKEKIDDVLYYLYSFIAICIALLFVVVIRMLLEI
jgi:superfamily II helicase